MKIYCENSNGVLEEIIPHFKLVKKIEDAERVVLVNDAFPREISIVKQAKVPVIIVQHGRHAPYVQYCHYKSPFYGDKICVWGSKDFQSCLEAGIPKEKIRLTGTTIYTKLYKKPHSQFTVLFCPAQDTGRGFFSDTDAATEELRKMPYWVITKLARDHPYQKKFFGMWQREFPNKYINPIRSDQLKLDHLSICAKALSEADVVLSNQVSTFELLAHYLNIPVVRTVAEISKAKDDPEQDKKILEEEGQYDHALEKMLAVIKED